MRVFGVAGWKNSGKTTLVERLVAHIVARGFTVSTVKHAHHAFDIDQPGKDSHRHRAAGAAQVLVASRLRWALITENRDAPEPPLADLLARLDPVDLVLVEGYKRDTHPKIEARRAETAQDPIAAGDATILAVASDTPLPGLDRPVFDLDDIPAIADFILAAVGLGPRETLFDTILAVDWSARAVASPARPTADALWLGIARDGAPEQPVYFRARAALMAHLADLLASEHAAGRRVLAGFDFPFGYPAGFAAALTGRAEALAVWSTLADRITDGPDNANNRFAVAAAINRDLGAGAGPFWGRPETLPLDGLSPRRGAAGQLFPELRAVERDLASRRVRAQTVWKLYTTGSVGGQVLTGLPALERLRADPRLKGALRVWPFETGLRPPAAPLVLAEIYPGLIDKALPHLPSPPPTRDAAQVLLHAAALARLDAAGDLAALFSPAVPAGHAATIAREEGWILGAGSEAAFLAAAVSAAKDMPADLPNRP